MITYEQQLDRNLDWALREGSMHFEKESAVYQALRKITKRLKGLGIRYALVGAMAMFFHGYRRFTDDVDLLVSRDDLKELHDQLEGRGYVPLFRGSKALRDAEYGVKVDFLVAGDYPGDGKPKPVAFPNPEEASIEIEGIPCLELAKIVELKLASGMTDPGRMKDLGDVQEMIRVLNLPADLSQQMHEFVREKYHEIWAASKHGRDEHADQ